MGRVKEMMSEPFKVNADVVLKDVTVTFKHLVLLSTLEVVPEFSGEPHPECFETMTDGAIFDIDEAEIDQFNFEKLLERKDVQDQIHDQAMDTWSDRVDSSFS
tara:strand:- start:1565 stop:1873 length:309 start_codon:yes stop_codon:yes gene_type:complete